MFCSALLLYKIKTILTATSLFAWVSIAEYISPNEPEPILLPNLNLLAISTSDDIFYNSKFISMCKHKIFTINIFTITIYINFYLMWFTSKLSALCRHVELSGLSSFYVK